SVHVAILVREGAWGILQLTQSQDRQSGVCCLADDRAGELIIFRAIAGLGNGGIKTNVQVIVSDVVSLQERGKYQGILAVCTAIANGIGPLLGGVFCQKIGWRWCFWINLPLTGFSIAVIQFFLPFKKVGGDWKTSLRRMDYLGSVIIFTATFCILLALNWGGNKFDWDTAPVLAPLIIGGLLVVAFVLVEQWDRVVKYPIIPSECSLAIMDFLNNAQVHLFKNRTVAAAYLNSLMSGMIFFGSLFYLPQYLQVVRQYSAIKSGALILALIVTHTAFSFMTGLLASKTSQYVWSIRSGYVSWSVGCGMFTTLAVNTAIPSFIGYSILAGVGAGCTFQISLVAIQASVKRGDMAVATGGRNFLNILGGAISLALCDTILRNTLTTKLSHAGLESDIIDETTKNPTQINTYDDSIRDTLLLSYCGGIRNIYILFTAFAGCMFVLSWLIKQHPLVRDDEAQLKEEGKKFAEEWKNDRKRGIKWRG
ncbi:hypothetical protein E3P99_04028, partial [Wallemia hederae]